MQKESQDLPKIEARIRFLKIRKTLSLPRRAEAAEAVLAALRNQGRVLSFFSIGSEIDLSRLNTLLAKENHLLLTRLEHSSLIPYFVDDMSCDLQISSHGIAQPDPSRCRRALLSEIDLILVPGIVFDAEGYRIGYGKGFYDRFLTEAKHIPTRGVGFREQFSKTPLPRDVWDVPVQELLLT